MTVAAPAAYASAVQPSPSMDRRMAGYPLLVLLSPAQASRRGAEEVPSSAEVSVDGPAESSDAIVLPEGGGGKEETSCPVHPSGLLLSIQCQGVRVLLRLTLRSNLEVSCWLLDGDERGDGGTRTNTHGCPCAEDGRPDRRIGARSVRSQEGRGRREEKARRV